jgi:hypothetical protein
MKVFANKIMRGNGQNQLINQLRRQSPNYDQYLAKHRFPSFPKIVLYTSESNPSRYLDKYLLR